MFQNVLRNYFERISIINVIGAVKVKDALRIVLRIGSFCSEINVCGKMGQKLENFRLMWRNRKRQDGCCEWKRRRKQMKTLGDIKRVLWQKDLLQGVSGWTARISEQKDKTEDEETKEKDLHKMNELPVDWLTCDSREVTENTLFICKGAAFQPKYLLDAIQKGAVAYISETKMEAPVPGLIVKDIRKAMAAASAWFWDYQAGSPTLTGITGTKGKTTTAWYLKAMLDEWEQMKGHPETGLISTVENYDGKSHRDAVMTTPEAPQLHELIANAQGSGVHYMTMEVSSQALKYKRVRELRFQVGIFLNISEDHISPKEHVDFEDYFSAKLSIFRQSETACVNLDCDHADRILKAAHKADHIVTFGKKRTADVRCSEIRANFGELSFRVTCDRFSEYFTLAMKGSFNIENAMAAITAGYVYGIPVECMKRALCKTKVPGRMENYVSEDGKICGIVDFAHNRLSFEKLFDAAFQEYASYRRIITVFGCPGEKAFNRRRELGVVAGMFSDEVIVTTDDPGMESQEAIAEQVRSYVEMTGCTCTCIADRWSAVCRAISLAEANRQKTLVLLLGRGSEKFQQIGGKSLACETDAQMMERAIRHYNEENHGRRVLLKQTV